MAFEKIVNADNASILISIEVLTPELNATTGETEYTIKTNSI